MKSNLRVAHPDWLERCNIAHVVKLWKSGKVPPAIEVFMLVTPLQHALRSIYGVSNIRVALILLCKSITEWAQYKWWAIQVALHFGEAYRQELEMRKADEQGVVE